MTVRIIREEGTYACRCDSRLLDVGILEEHIVAAGADPDEHAAVNPAHTTDRIRDARERAERRQRTRAAVARSAGVSVEELREALR